MTDIGNIEGKACPVIANHIKVALVGQPNVGKSMLINSVSNSHLHVGNFSGVTVDKTEVLFDYKDYHFTVVDLPGTYAFTDYTIEERVTHDYLCAEEYDIIINVVDSTNLEKNLQLTAELMSMSKSMVIALLSKDSIDQNEFSMNNDMILNLIKKVEFSNEELISIAKNYKTSMSPDQLIKLFEDISTYNEDYTTSYLYVLAQFEMVDSMRDILINSENNEYSAFKAIIDLKDAGKNTYSLDTLCYK